MKLIKKSKKLNNVLYDIRGPIVDRAKEMEAQGQQLIKLNIGNLASFDFQVPDAWAALAAATISSRLASGLP